MSRVATISTCLIKMGQFQQPRIFVNNQLDTNVIYTVKARVRRDGLYIDLEVFKVQPLKEEVVVFYIDGSNHIEKGAD